MDRRKRRREGADQLRASFREFVRQSWHVVEPSKSYIDNWHIDAIAEHLQAVADGQIQYLLINVPPGHAKSLIVSVQFPAWLWTRDPKYRLICGTYEGKLTVRDAVRSRDLITSRWYQETFTPSWKLKDDSNAKDEYYTTETGFRISVSVTGRGTGLRANGIILDDVLSVEQAYSDAERSRAVRWVSETMFTRRNDLEKDWQVAIGQRLHESDPYGEMLKDPAVVHLCLPSEFDPARKCTTRIGWSDPRTQKGELLFPALFPAAVIEKSKTVLGPYAYAGQHQQRPAPLEGGMYKRWWWRYWAPRGHALPDVQVQLADGSYRSVKPVELPDRFDLKIQSWDMTFEKSEKTDYVVGQVWGKVKADKFLLDQVRNRMDFVETQAAVRYLDERWPGCHAKYVEKKANGAAILSSLGHEISGLLPVEPIGSKEARAFATTPAVAAGNVYLPHPAIAPWVRDFIDEHAVFPNGAHDDMVDGQSQALHKLQSTPQFFCGIA